MIEANTRRFCHWALLVLAFMASEAAGQTPVTKVITWTPPASGEIYVGILGEVGRPGVYALEPQALTVQSVVHRAGGMAESASGTIRIVRQDRVVESVYFSPHVSTPILANDLLVVESQQARAAITSYYESDPRGRNAASLPVFRGTDPSGVQVAFVNVLDRPVIVKIKHENARVDQVVRMLDQPQELAQSVRVIGPERMIAQGAASPQATLSEGSILVFPRSAVNRRRLPSLPSPYESEIASGAVPSLIGGPSGQSPELRNVGQLPPLMTRDTSTSRAPAGWGSGPAVALPIPAPDPVPGAPIAAPPRDTVELPPANPATPLVHASPRIATLPFSGQPRVTSSSQAVTVTPEPAIDPIPKAAAQVDPQFKSDLNAPEADSAELQESSKPEIQEPARLTGLQILAVLLCVGTLIGLSLAVRKRLMGRDALGTQSGSQISTPAESEPEAIPGTAETGGAVESAAEPAQGGYSSEWFDQLLAGTLPVIAEKPEFPTEIRLQGQIIPPPVFRVDAAHAVAEGPHFVTQPRPSAPPDAAEEEVIDTFDAPHAVGPAKPHFLRRRPGEQTVAAAAMAAARNRSPEQPLSPTPVTDALRQLQGEQS